MPAARRTRPVTAVRGGAFLLGAMVAGNATNYAFTIVAGRVLGPSDYGVLTALMALLMIIQLPLGALQMAISREVAAHRATQGEAYAAELVRRTLRIAVLATVGLTAVFMASVAPLSYLLQIREVGPVAVVGLAVVPTAAVLVLMGDLQGRQQYAPLALSTALPNVLRLVVFAVLAAIGWALYGALAAVALSTVLALLVTAWWTRDTFSRGRVCIEVDLARFLRYLLPVALGILAITALTNMDVLAVKGRLSPEDAGIFGAASNLAKLAVLLPMAIVGVLFPRVAQRRARGVAADDILGRALVVTLAFCVLLFGTYLVLGDTVVSIAFGSDYAQARSLLTLFGVAMTAFSLANVLLSYELALGRSRYAVILAIAAAVHALLLTVVPAALTSILWLDSGMGIAVLAAYQLERGGALAALRLGVSHTRRDLDTRRRAAVGWDWVVARRAALAEAGIVLAGAAVVAVAATWPLAAHLGTGVLGGGDAYGAVAWLWRISEEGGYRVVGSTHSTLTGAPFGFDQGNGVNLQWLLPFFPAHLLSGIVGDVVAYNLVVLSGITLSGAAMYALVRGLGGRPVAAAWGGIAYMTFPWLLARADGHGSLTHVWGFPLLILAVARWRARPDLGRAAAVGVAVLALCMTSGYFGLMGLITATVLLAAAVVTAERGARARWAGHAVVAAAGAVLAMGLIFGLSRLGTGRGTFGAPGPPSELQAYGVRLHEFLVPPVSSSYFAAETAPFLLARQHGSNPSESAIYVGLLTIALALGWLVWALGSGRRRGPATRFLLVALPAVVAVAIILALPHPLHVAGYRVPAPSRLVFAVVPEFRVLSRWSVVVMAALVPMAALGLGRLAAAASAAVRRRGAPTGLATSAALAVGAVAIVLTHVELATRRAPVAPLATAPPEYALLDRAPRGIVAEYPLEPAAQAVTSDYLVWQREHGRRLLNGAPAGSTADAFRAGLVDAAAPGTAPGLAALGVSVIVDHRAAAAPGPGFALVGRASDGASVWRVVARPGVAVGYGTGFNPPEVQPDGRVFRWMSLPTSDVVVFTRRPGRRTFRFSAGSYGAPRTLTLTGPGFRRTFRVGPTARFAFTARLPAGLSRVALTVRPGPQPIPDGRMVAVYMSDWTVTPAATRSVPPLPAPAPAGRP